MSFDLMVLEPGTKPSTKEGFDAWYQKTVQWEGDHDHDDLAHTSPLLRAWFMDMIKMHPAMNGPFAADEDDIDNPRIGDYCITPEAIYVGFAWSVAEEAGMEVWDAAQRHGLVMYDPQSDTLMDFSEKADAPAPKPDAPKGFWAKLRGLFGN
jgi:hypothetical protein